MKEIESENANFDRKTQNRSMNTNGLDTQGIVPTKQENKMPVVSRGSLIVVSERQFETVRSEQLATMDLLNSSANVLLSAMKSVVPPEDSGRIVGEYAGQNLRQMAKSICDLVTVKNHVVRQMYAVARDEF